jgi:hypothetical protein
MRQLSREDSSWSVHSVSGRFVPGGKEKTYSDSLGFFYDPDGKISKRKKAPQTQILLVPVSLTPIKKEVDTGCKEEDPLDQTQQRAVSAIGRSRVAHHEEEPDDESTSTQSEAFVDAAAEGGFDSILEKYKPRQAFPAFQPVTGEEDPDQPVLARTSTSSRRFSVSAATNTWIAQKRSSLMSAESDKQLLQARFSGSLKDWFDSADRERSSSLSGQSSLRGPMKSPGSAGSGRMYENEPENKRSAMESKREAIRRELIKIVGGPMEAFRMIDLSGSGSISQTEFADGLYRIGVDWQELTNSNKVLEVFRLFDRNRNGTISMEELFPEERYALDAESCRMSTPEFWYQWCRKTANSDRSRAPRWASSGEEEMAAMIQTQDYRQERVDERRRMRAMIRRMQKQGKSDARCRECVATHLPRGTGPKDRESVLTFSDAEVRACRRAYNETTSNHVRNISKNVYEMRESKRVLQGLRHKFSEQVMRTKNEAFEGLHLFGPHDSGDSKSDVVSTTASVFSPMFQK